MRLRPDQDRLVRSTLIVTLCLGVVPSIIATLALLTQPSPEYLFASGLVVDGWRSASGLLVYEDPLLGHCTHMYGALHPWTLGRLYTVTGLSVVAGRVLSLLCALTLISLLLWCVRARLRGFGWWIAVGLWIAAGHRVDNYYATNLPDIQAWLLAFLGLYVHLKAVHEKNLRQAVLSSALFVTAFFFKQTALMLVLVAPLELLFLKASGRNCRAWLAALLPAASGALTLVFLSTFLPHVFFYMVTMPARVPIVWRNFVQLGFTFLITIPVFWGALLLWLADRKYSRRSSQKGTATPLPRQILLTAAVSFPLSLITVAKLGGAQNSFLPAVIAVTMFSCHQIPELLKAIEKRRAVSLVLLAIALFIQMNPDRRFETYYFKENYPVATEYDEVVALARTLPGTVVSPEDPTIALRAKGTFGLSLGQELDCITWAESVPPKIEREIVSADFLIEVSGYGLFDAAYLKSLGFTVNRELKAYRIWKRAL